ncbi:MAG TPA: hypothetical protein VHU80_15575 [Polyangiaceae bacterium]|jgi:hypothetical protein|nr:hypothetical protein [Polyangiaceae bacterium]
MPRSRGLARWFLSIGLTTFASVAGFAGCGSTCDGIKIDGECQTECKDSLCAKNAKCFQNSCRLACSTTDDCPEGETCHSAVTDHGTKGKFCVGTPKAVAGTTGAPCKASADCMTAYGFRCIGKACALTCELHAQCGKAGSCTGTAKDTDGDTVHTCETDSFLHGPGQYGASCPNIAGSDGGVSAGCDAANEFVCVGRGPGDVDAYCTQRYCGTDDDCPSGFFCATDRVDQPPCEDVCNLGGVKDPSCIASSDIGDGKHYACGAATLTVNTCRHREFCSSCNTDADCLGSPDQLCAADQSGEKICTILCDANLNSCPWGSAAVCGKWDKERNVDTCAHRFASCHGMGQGCEPCRDEKDCPGGICKQATFSGERYCVDFSTQCSCSSDTTQACTGGGCPMSPSGEPQTCLGGSAYKTSPTYDICFGANTDPGQSASREGCWPSL